MTTARSRRPVTWLRASLLALALLAGCTGSQETRTPVVLFVGGNDGDATLTAYRTGLPPDGPDDPSLVALPGLTRTLPGTLIDLAAVPEGAPALLALYRDAADDDRLAVYDAARLDPADGGSLAATPDEDLNLSAAVADAGVLDERLCAAAMTVASDAAWIGVLHLPSACGLTGAPAVLALERASVGTATPRVEPDAPGTQDAAADPIFVGRGDDERLVWLSDAGTILRWSTDAASDAPTAVDTPLDANPTAIGRSGTGVAVAAGRDLAFVSLGGGDPAPVWTLDGIGTIESLVAADSLPGVSAVALGSSGLSIVSDLDQEPDDERIDRLSDATLDHALIGPYGYLFVTSDVGLIAYDALEATTGGSLSRIAGSGQDLGSLRTAGLAWIFAAPTATP